MADYYKPYTPEGAPTYVNQAPKTDELLHAHIGKHRYLTCGSFNGENYVGIRQFYYDNDETLRPTKSGLHLSVNEWNAFMRLLPKIKELIIRGQHQRIAYNWDRGNCHTCAEPLNIAYFYYGCAFTASPVELGQPIWQTACSDKG
ncbi:putative RNA polymerase II transcriptional coactivator [Nymphon striatum]|nr:putative RNA polymerase II transcriptional coactivator [Nymphon striatum]KAG1674757.1 putative RNA polymerase II transcriptional coactivator [Nymphon striatum]